MAIPYRPPTLAEIQFEIDRLKDLISTYESNIRGFRSDQANLRSNSATQQTTIDRITKSTGNTKTVYSWTGVTSYTADVGFVTTLVAPPTNNTTVFYIPSGADVNFEYNVGSTDIRRVGRPIFPENNWVNPDFTYHPAKSLNKARYEWYRNQTINIQWNFSDVCVSMEHVKNRDGESKPTGKVLLFNRKTKNYVRVQLMLPQPQGFCGVNVFFASGHSIALMVRRSPNPNLTKSADYKITRGDIGNSPAEGLRGAGTKYWWTGSDQLNIPLRDLRNTFNSMPFDKDQTTYIDFEPTDREDAAAIRLSRMDKNAYYFRNTGVVQSPLVTALKPYKDIIVANDKAIKSLETRITDTTKLLDGAKIKLKAEQNLAETTKDPVVVTPVVPVIPNTVINNNTTNTTNITNVTNVTNVNTNTTTTNNINQTFYNVNVGTVVKPTTPNIQLPPPINIAALLASLGL